MSVVYHPAVQQDVSQILRYYDGINGRLGEIQRFRPEGSDQPATFPF